MKTTASRPKIVMSSDGSGLISHSGALLLLETLRVTGLDQALSEQLRRWPPARAIHAPGKIIADLAVSLALGGDCLADISILRHSPELFGPIAYDADRQPRHGAWVAELTALLDLTSWPKGMRVIVRKERPHPGAQLRFTDLDGHRFTCFVTGTRPGGGRGQLADLELRHRRRARCEDRIRTAKDTGLRNLPLHRFAQNQI